MLCAKNGALPGRDFRFTEEVLEQIDRGIPTEQSLAVMRESGIDYLIGTPRKLLDEFQCELVDKDWQQVNESVDVKYLEKEGECYVLARSKSRMAKERAISKRKLRRYLDGLAKLQKTIATEIVL